jgi:hypothetical protein
VNRQQERERSRPEDHTKINLVEVTVVLNLWHHKKKIFLVRSHSINLLKTPCREITLIDGVGFANPVKMKTFQMILLLIF